MSEHVTQWLAAYYDGELKGHRAQQIERHLEICPQCLAELEDLNMLSNLLQQVPAPENLTPPETFVAQLGLRLPRKTKTTSWQKMLHTSWQWAPAGLLGVWVFIQTAFIVSGILMWVFRFVPGIESLAAFIPQGSNSFLSQSNFSGIGFSELSRFGLEILESGGPLGWGITLNLGFTLLIGLLFFSWLASWWVQKSNGDLKITPA